jgi:nitroreductase
MPSNRFEVLVRDVTPGEDLVETLGAYGRIVSPPHYLVPYTIGDVCPLTDLGFRVEQIAVRLAGTGIGSCYVGSLGRENLVRKRFGLPATARVGAFLAFGYPATSVKGRAFNATVRRFAGATNKLPADRIFFDRSFDNPTAPPVELAPLVEAARSAPSAANAQPWRLLWRDSVLYLFVQRVNRRYGTELNADYRLYDGGICMGNVALALEALGMAGRWRLREDVAPDSPGHPTSLQLLAELSLRDTVVAEVLEGG